MINQMIDQMINESKQQNDPYNSSDLRNGSAWWISFEEF